MTFLILIFKKYIGYIILIAIISSLFLLLRIERKAKRDYKDAYIGIQTEVVFYKDRNNHNVARIEELALTNRTLFHIKDSTVDALLQENKAMGIKLRKTEQLIGIQSFTKDTITVVIRDTTIIRDSSVINRMSTYNDGYLNLKIGLYEDLDSLLIDYQYKDNLVISGFWERDMDIFWLIRWLYAKKYYVAVKSLNPKTQIGGLRVITFKKNKL